MPEYIVIDRLSPVERIVYEVIDGKTNFIKEVKFELWDGREIDAVAYGDRVVSRFPVDGQTITVNDIGAFGLYRHARGKHPYSQ